MSIEQMLRGIVLFILILILNAKSYGQRGFEIGGWAGLCQYYGELNSNPNLVRPGLALGLVGKYNFNTRVISRLSLNYGRARGTDVTASNNFEKNRNLSFYSNIFDLDLGVEFNFFNYVHNSREQYFTPFMTLGLTLSRFNPKAEYEGETYALRELGTEGQDANEEYFLLSVGPSLGLGAKWDIARDINMTIEASMRFPMTDYLDDVSTVYPDYDELEDLRGIEAVYLSNRTLNDVAGQPDKQRGNSTNNDKYLFIGISINKFFGQIQCPRISNIGK